MNGQTYLGENDGWFVDHSMNYRLGLSVNLQIPLLVRLPQNNLRSIHCTFPDMSNFIILALVLVLTQSGNRLKRGKSAKNLCLKGRFKDAADSDIVLLVESIDGKRTGP
jgi:hypothetical protein